MSNFSNVENQKKQLPFYFLLIAFPLSTTLMEVAKLLFIVYFFYFSFQKNHFADFKKKFSNLPFLFYLLIGFLFLHILSIVFSRQWFAENNSDGTLSHLLKVFIPQMVIFVYTYLFLDLRAMKKMHPFIFSAIFISSLYGLIMVSFFQERHSVGFYGHHVTYGQILSLFWVVTLLTFCFNLENFIIKKKKNYYSLILLGLLLLLIFDINNTHSRSVALTVAVSFFLIAFYYFFDKKIIFFLLFPVILVLSISFMPPNLKARGMLFAKIFKREPKVVTIDNLSFLVTSQNSNFYRAKLICHMKQGQDLKAVTLYTKFKKEGISFTQDKQESTNTIYFDVPKKILREFTENQNTVTLLFFFKNKEKAIENLYCNINLKNNEVQNHYQIESYNLFYQSAFRFLKNSEIKNYLNEFWNLRVNLFNVTREILWKSTLSMIRKKASLGYGPKTWRKFANDINYNDFAYIYLHERDDDHFYSHSNFLDIAYRSGTWSALVFLFFLLSILFGVTYKVFSLKKKYQNSDQQTSYQLLVIIIICFWSLNLSGIFDSTLFSVGVTVGSIYWFLLAILLQFLHAEKTKSLTYFK